MYALKLTQIGNSVGVILPREVLARLKLELEVASGTIEEDGFAQWIRTQSKRALKARRLG